MIDVVLVPDRTTSSLYCTVMGRGTDGAALRAAEAHTRLVGGNLSGVGPVLRELASVDNPEARAWRAALETQVWLAAPSRVLLPALSVLEQCVDGPLAARSVALLCAVNLALARMLRFEGDVVERLADLCEPLAGDLHARDGAHAALVRTYAAVVRGEGERATVLAQESARLATSERLASALVQATALASLAAACDGHEAEALTLARRASLMGRSEGIPHAEFLAHLSLARVRRLARQPHLALRVVSALRDFATPPWMPWLAWEWTFAGGARALAASDLERAPACPASGAASSLLALLGAARSGDRVAFGARALVLSEARDAGVAFATSEATDSWPPSIQGEHPAATRCVPGAPERACSPRRRSTVSGCARPTRRGTTRRPRTSFSNPAGRVARLMHWGVPLLDANGVVHFKQSHRAEGRIETLLSVLALASTAGIPEEQCFLETYGFTFVPAVHRGVFDVLLHRARAAIEGVATSSVATDACTSRCRGPCSSRTLACPSAPRTAFYGCWPSAGRRAPRTSRTTWASRCAPRRAR